MGFRCINVLFKCTDKAKCYLEGKGQESSCFSLSESSGKMEMGLLSGLVGAQFSSCHLHRGVYI